MNNELDTNINIDDFTGPFYVLVELISSKKMDITSVSLSDVTDQYIEAINRQEKDINPYHLADFLVVASRLIYLKSKSILPYLSNSDEDEEAENLEERLKIYEKYHKATQNIEKILKQNKFMYSREKMIHSGETIFNPPHNVTVFDLKDLWIDIIKRIEPVFKIPEKVIKKVISIKEKIKHIQERIFQAEKVNFYDLVKQKGDTTEIVVSFLAVLELVKQRTVEVVQEDLYDDIIIKKSND